jgi:hypothetical protein
VKNLEKKEIESFIELIKCADFILLQLSDKRAMLGRDLQELIVTALQEKVERGLAP